MTTTTTDRQAHLRILQSRFRRRLAVTHNRTDLLPGCADMIRSPLCRDWGNASPEMLTGGIVTTPEMRDALREIESEVA